MVNDAHRCFGALIPGWVGLVSVMFSAGSDRRLTLQSPTTLPAVPRGRTGLDAMGDGHHGWAVAEIVLFLVKWKEREGNEE